MKAPPQSHQTIGHAEVGCYVGEKDTVVHIDQAKLTSDNLSGQLRGGTSGALIFIMSQIWITQPKRPHR